MHFYHPTLRILISDDLASSNNSSKTTLTVVSSFIETTKVLQAS